MTLEAGIYRIHNFFYPIVVDLNNGGIADGTPIAAWKDNKGLNQAWLIRPVSPGSDTYTIRNVASGTVMDLANGSSKNGTAIAGWHSHGGANQQWIIRKSGDGNWYKIQNKASKTFVDLYNGGTANGTKITGWQGNWNTGGHQGWSFTKISVHGGEVHKLVKENPHLKQDFTSYRSDGLYLVLTQDHFNDIWKNSGLGEIALRDQIFDRNDFALRFKSAVAAWGNEHIKADGFAILCGVVYTSNEAAGHKSSHAYNWYVVEGHLENIVFFEPKEGKPDSHPAGYNAFFGFF